MAWWRTHAGGEGVTDHGANAFVEKRGLPVFCMERARDDAPFPSERAARTLALFKAGD